jgi:hypothetical protein
MPQRSYATPAYPNLFLHSLWAVLILCNSYVSVSTANLWMASAKLNRHVTFYRTRKRAKL